jgi:type II secretory pathway component PulK
MVTRGTQQRRGMTLIVVIAVFAVAMALCAAWTKAALGRLHHEQLAEQRVQAAWLAEAGVRRGAAQLAADGTYAGESWLVPAAELARPGDARVDIEIDVADNAPEVARITAVAAYPADRPRVRIRKTVTFPLPAEDSQR